MLSQKIIIYIAISNHSGVLFGHYNSGSTVSSILFQKLGTCKEMEYGLKIMWQLALLVSSEKHLWAILIWCLSCFHKLLLEQEVISLIRTYLGYSLLQSVGYCWKSGIYPSPLPALMFNKLRQGFLRSTTKRMTRKNKTNWHWQKGQYFGKRKL